jgi:hypothetical protein
MEKKRSKDGHSPFCEYERRWRNERSYDKDDKHWGGRSYQVNPFLISPVIIDLLDDWQ